MTTDTNRTNITWNNEDPATPELVKPLLDNIGLGDQGTENARAAREATRKHCLELLTGSLASPWKMRELSAMAGSYYDGYLDCLKEVKCGC